MGAVALTPGDEEALISLQKELHLPSKSQVIHRALEELRITVAREQLALEIKKSVQKCSQADQQEHASLKGSAFYSLPKSLPQK